MPSTMSWIPVPDGSPFPAANLPLGVGHRSDGRPRVWVAVGDSALDLAVTNDAGLLDGLGLPDGCFADRDLNRFLAAGPEVWSRFRARLQEILTDAEAAYRLGFGDDGTGPNAVSGAVVARSELVMAVPTWARDYVDFYSSIHHATNLGRLFRPDGEALLPNWRRIPIGYHGRSATLVADGATIRRPAGYRRQPGSPDGAPRVGPTDALDIELEVGTVVGVGSGIGQPIAIEDAGRHLYGMCLVNDWSARDIQAYEYQPLGPFLGKSFATSVSPWLVSFEALEPFRVAPPVQDPPPAPYLSTGTPWGFDLHLEVWLESAAMRAAGTTPVCISRVGFADMYWTPAQQLAHMTVNGAATSPGDLFASGTVSGPDPGTEGSLIELTWRGERPIELPDGTTRSFLEDGDRVELRGWAGSDRATRIGLGSVTGTIEPAAGTVDT
jgi:fumarylacetoacetase